MPKIGMTNNVPELQSWVFSKWAIDRCSREIADASPNSECIKITGTTSALCRTFNIDAHPIRNQEQQMTETDFLNILRGIARSWTEGDASAAAEFFDMDAVYEEPPKQQFYRGRESILGFFRAAMSDDTPLTMIWRNDVFDPKTNVGFGEYTFSRLKQFHGIVVMQF